MSTEHGNPVQSDERRWKGRVWCTRCSALLATSEADIVAVCPTCRAQVDWDAAIRRSHAWTALKEAEQKVEILLKSAGGEDLEDFEVDEDS